MLIDTVDTGAKLRNIQDNKLSVSIDSKELVNVTKAKVCSRVN